jgi:hypothetical protein
MLVNGNESPRYRKPVPFHPELRAAIVTNGKVIVQTNPQTIPDTAHAHRSGL